MKITFSLAFLFLVNCSFATTVAVIDTGVDYTNDFLSSKILLNPLDCNSNGIDDDNNGFIDDCYGWNYVEGNKNVFNFTEPVSYSSNTSKLFQYAYMKTYEDHGVSMMDSSIENWFNLFSAFGMMDSIINNAIKWSTYSQGTHTAGIIARQSADTKILPIKYLSDSPNDSFRVADVPLLESQLTTFANDSVNNLFSAVLYAKARGAKVIHSSLVEDYDFVKINQISQLGVITTEAEAITFTDFYQTARVDGLKTLVESESDLVFVFPSGDSGVDISTAKSFPSSIGANNSIVVGVSLDRTQILSSSSYSGTLVDIVAPGLGILSGIPGDNWLNFSGSTTAAAYVSGICGAMIDENPNLSPIDIKSIVLQTADIKAFLAGLVVSSGVINKKRAIAAAYYSLELPLIDAIALSRAQISDISESAVYSQ